MKRTVILVFTSLLLVTGRAQLYFPPNSSGTWDTLSPAGMNWCENKIDSLYDFLESNNTKAFILLKNGKIVLEQYFNGHDASSFWYWASAGKSLTALLVGIAQQESFLDITDTTSAYLGEGWTSCTTLQEERITIRHQLTMTSGLDDAVPDPYCTIDTCLHYLADPGTRWAYHNAPYTLLDPVVETATGQTLNLYHNLKVKTPTGMDGFYIQQGFNNTYYSTARSMARFGLLILNKGNWDGYPVLNDTSYFQEMVNTSQDLNHSYGYLWWLNGKDSYMIPQSQYVFNGSLCPNAPDDMIAALGKNGQFINVIPSADMVWIRMGEAPGTTLVPFTFNDDIWQYINALDCQSTGLDEIGPPACQYRTWPNPVNDVLQIHSGQTSGEATRYSLFNSSGMILESGMFTGSLHKLFLGECSRGLYLLVLQTLDKMQVIKIVKN